jgi:CHAT domain-containing protein
LTALEITGIDLNSTQMVVLSACDTGLGDIANGEGVYRLRRAFTLAGAQSQLMSLWQVDDAGTKELMVAFYEKLLQGESRADAL